MEKPKLIINTDTFTHQRLKRSVNYIYTNYNMPLTADEISTEAYLSKYHFIRLFKENYNRTPHQYLTERRIEKAKYLLETSEKTILDICFEVGFQSLGSFGILFRKKTGFSPSEFRREKCRRKVFAVKKPGIIIPICYIKTFCLK